MLITEDMVDKLMSCNLEEYTLVLSDINELTEELIFMLKNPEISNENKIYDCLDLFRKVCKVISGDDRATGTLMKHLGIC